MPNAFRSHATLAVSLPSDTPHRTAGCVSKLAADFFGALEQDEETGARVRMVAQELAENIVKYSSGGQTAFEIAIENGHEARRVRMTARNRAEPVRTTEVRRRISELSQASDPIALYDRLIRETAPRQGVSGLGLARIFVEGGFRLTCEQVGEDLVVTAILALQETTP